MSEYPYTRRIQLRLNAVDPNKHVNNTAVVTIRQDARIGDGREPWDGAGAAASVAVVSLDVDVRAPIGMDETVDVDVRLVDVGTSSWTLEDRVRTAEATVEERVAATATFAQVAWDVESGGSTTLPGTWRSGLEAARVEAAD